jgi:hypothetical protein
MPSGEEEEIAERGELCTFLTVPAAVRPLLNFTSWYPLLLSAGQSKSKLPTSTFVAAGQSP